MTESNSKNIHRNTHEIMVDKTEIKTEENTGNGEKKEIKKLLLRQGKMTADVAAEGTNAMLSGTRKFFKNGAQGLP